MKSKFLIDAILIFVACAMGATTVYAEKIHPINMTLSGSIMDVDQEGALKLFDLNLKGTPGSANARGVGWGGDPVNIDDLPEGNICYDIPPIPGMGDVDGVNFLEFQMTMNFKDGSMLFANATSGYLCFAPAIAIGNYEIVGGTGRFDGATGWVDAELILHRFNATGHPSLVTAETGTVIGEIIFP